jgi:spore coat protein U-like protein
MKTIFDKRFKYKALFAALIGMSSINSWAAYNCTTFSVGPFLTYPLNTLLDRSGELTINCTRLITDPQTNTYYVGIDDTNTTRRFIRTGGSASVTSDRLDYEIYREASYASTWNYTSRPVTGTISFGAGNLSTSFTLPFYLRVMAQTGKVAGSYADADLGVRVRIPSNQPSPFAGQNDIQVTAVINPTCALTTTGGQITLNYPSFSPSAVTGSTIFGLTCTKFTPFTVSLAPGLGTIVGLQYTSVVSYLDVASGVAQDINITVTLAAGQSGVCATGTCSGTQQQTLTITY